MRIGICNLLKTSVHSGVNSNSSEIIAICNQLNEIDGVYCEVINKVKSEIKRNLFGSYNSLGFNSIYYKDANPDNYDFMLVMNSNPNFFGGVESEEIVGIYKFLHNFKNPIIYLYNDTNCTLKSLRVRNNSTFTEDDVSIDSPIYVVSQFFDVNKSISENSKNFNIKGGKHIDFGTWMLKDYEKKIHKNKSTYDLIYGGSFRSGKREKKFIDYFFNKSINVALYGTIKESDFKLPYTNSPKNWLGKVNCNDVIETNALGFSSIICGEPGYNNNIHTIRQYESILANCVTFIDSDYDTNHVIYPNCDFLYINNGEELESRIKELQTSNNIDYILDAQFEFIDRKSKCGYIKELLDYMEEIKQCTIG